MINMVDYHQSEDLANAIQEASSFFELKGLRFEQADESQREKLRAFHHESYLEETSNVPGEREWQETQMEGWYPQYYDAEAFS